MNFAFDPIPHAAARLLISAKPAVVRDVFDSMEPEMKQRAFLISGVEDFDILQGVRDQIATLPAGADWGKVKKEIAAKISPWFTPAAAEARAHLLMSHHAFTAYAACEARIMDEMADVFPYRQYLSTKDGKVRASHRALHGIILPAKHPFWEGHTPPWEFNCRCQVVELTAEDAAEERVKDAKRNPEDRRVLEGAALTHLENGRIARGPSMDIALGQSLQRVADYNLPYEDLAARWDTGTRQHFEAWAARIPLETGTLFDALAGNLKSQISNLKSKTRPASFAAALADSGLAAKPAWTRAEVANLRALMRVPNPAQAADLIASVSGARQTGVLTDKEIRRTVQDLLDILPREIADTLPPLRIKLVERFTKGDRGAKDTAKDGDYLRLADGGPAARVAVASLKGLKGEARRRELRRLLSHELHHWLHLDATGPAADRFRAVIRAHHARRGPASPLWHTPQAGAAYPWEGHHPQGLEVVPWYAELWEAPEELIGLANLKHPQAAAFRETFSLINSIFFP